MLNKVQRATLLIPDSALEKLIMSPLCRDGRPIRAGYMHALKGGFANNYYTCPWKMLDKYGKR